MLELEYAIIDIHGNVLPSPVIVINSLNYQSTEHSHSSTTFNSSEGLTPRSDNSTVSHNMTFTALIWKDQEAYALKRHPMPLRDAHGNDWFTVPLTQPLSTPEEREAFCKQFIQESVINQLKVLESN